jgi:hypothetical protein
MRQLFLTFVIMLLSCQGVAATEPGVNEIWLDGVPVESLQLALKHAKHNSVVMLGAGDYEQAAVVKKNNVTIEGMNGSRIHTKTTQGKAAIVVKGNDTIIKNIECFNIKVKHKNGACVRLEGRNLTLENVYFHDSQQGLLTNSKPGSIYILNSRFERLGKSGKAHGIYVGGGRLFIKGSSFLSTKDQGHEIKSRASETRIENSVIASLNGNDSRLVDIPNGGKLSITDSVLGQGPNSVNWNLIGFGLEGYKYKENSVTLIGNIFILERERGNKVLDVKNQHADLDITQNAFIGRLGKESFGDSNFYFDDRESAGLDAFPALPDIIK